MGSEIWALPTFWQEPKIIKINQLIGVTVVTHCQFWAESSRQTCVLTRRFNTLICFVYQRERVWFGRSRVFEGEKEMRMACPNSIIDSQYYQLKFTVRMSTACPTGVLYLFIFKKIRNPGKFRKIPKNLENPKKPENLKKSGKSQIIQNIPNKFRKISKKRKIPTPVVDWAHLGPVETNWVSR